MNATNSNDTRASYPGTEVIRPKWRGCFPARGTVLKHNRDSKGERHVIVNGVLIVKQGKRVDHETSKA